LFPASIVYHDRGHQMKDPSIANQELIDENALLKQRIQILEKTESERKQAEEALQESERHMKLALEGTDQGLWEWDILSRKVVYDENWQRIMNLPSEGRSVDMDQWLACMDAEGRAAFEIKMTDYLAGREKYYEFEHRLQTENKDWKWIWTRGIATERDPSGIPLRMIGTYRDITKHKQQEEERKILEERLQRSEKIEALGTLAGGVAHDLNNVLGVVVGYAELLLNSVDQASPIRPRLVNIMKGGEQAAAIVQDLLTLARRGVSNRQILNLNKLIVDGQQSPEFANLSSHHPAMQLKLDLDPELLNIAGSPVHIRKTIYNLAANAGEAMARGGVLTIKTANQYLDKPIQGYEEVREGDYVVLSMSDTGEGIAAADLKRIFEPFYTKKVMGRSGTGLGLAVVMGTVKDHKGYINVHSVEDRGSTFALYFPVSRGKISADVVTVDVSSYTGKGEAILIVDDVKEQRDLATEMLRNLNYTVMSVSSGEEAVAYLQEHHADLVVLDMIMDPGMDGLDTYRSILQIHPKQKAVIVSGFSETNRVNAAQALGAGTYVKKPYIVEKLGLAVRKELDLSA
jgi:PAS domain S-box-containing protein